jgi:O-antigen/teichoic acid export membrane protein
LLVALAGAAPRIGIFLAWNVPVVFSLLPVNLLIFRRLVRTHLQHANVEWSWNPRRIIRFAAGNYIGQLFLLASTILLPVIVTIEEGATANAYFYIPWAISTGLQVVALNMTTSLTVEVAFDESKLRDYCRRIVFQTLRIIVPVAIGLAIAAPYVLRPFGARYASEGTDLLRLLALALIPNVIVALGLSVARIQHNARMVILIQGSLCIPIIGISLLLLPRFGITGVGVAWLAAQTVVGFVLMLGILRPVLFIGAPAGVSADRRLQGSDES